MSKIKHSICITGIITLAFGGILASIISISPSTHAMDTTVANKAIAYGIYECYKDGNIINKVSLTDYDGLNSITDYGNNIILPTGYYDISSVNCGQLIGGDYYSNFKGAVSINGVSIPGDNSNTSAVSTFLKGMGYTETKADGGKCASYTYYYTDDPASTNVTKMCASVDSSGRITSDRVEISGDNFTCMQIEVEDKAIKLDCNQLAGFDGGCGRHEFTPGVTDFETFAGEILGDLEAHHSTALWGAWTLDKHLNIESRGDVLAKFEFRDRSDAAKAAIKYLTGYNSLSATKLSETERISLLQGYLKDYYKIDNYGCNIESSQQNIAKGAGYIAINTNMFSGGGYQVCWIKPTANVGFSVAGYNSQNYFDGTPMSYDEIIAALGGTVDDLFEADKQKCNDAAEQQRRAAQNLLNQSTTSEEYRERARKTIAELDKILRDHGEYWYEENGAIVCYPFTDINGQVVTPPTETPNPPSGGGSTGDEGDDGVYPCLEAAESLGWVLCPVLHFLGNTIDTIYKSVEDSFLIVDVDMLNSDTHEAWEQFRNFANMIFIIAFLVVILSQVTGFGVSNYGVKKILPRLIAMAILVNVSFIICQLAVEVSNIVGAHIKDLLGSLGVVNLDGHISPGSIATEILSVLGLGATVAAAPAITAALAETASFWLLPILVAFIGFLIGIVFAGILLAARQAGVIILVVLSPVAIVCYALPNTKSIFDKWRKAFVALLLVYPMCGAIVGGGQFATALLINNNGGFFYTLVAMLLSIVPFFLIPSMIRSSMSSLGSIGTRISGAGQRLSRWAQGAVRGSRTYQDGQRNLDMFSARRTVDRLNAREASGRQLSDRQKRRRSRALSRGIALMEEDMRAGADTRAFPSARTAEGQAAIDAMRAKIFEDAMDDRIAEEEAAYRNSSAFDVNSISDLEAEHERLINALDVNPNDAKSIAQMRAIQNLLMTQGDPGQEAIFKNYMKRAASGGDSSGLRAAARHIAGNGKYMQKIKAEDKGLFSAINHFKTGDFSHAGSGAAAFYGAQGAGGYTAQTLAAADLGAIDRLVEGVTTGTISGGDLRKLTSLANEALSNPNLQIKGDVRQKLENLVAAGYSVGGSATGVSSAGSTALSGASLETLDSMVQRIRAINGGTAFTGAPTAPGAALDEYNEVQAMARNAERALRNPNTPHDAATVDRLQDILMAAQDMGVKDTSGGDFNRVDPAAIKIRGVEKRTAPPTPSGWAPTGVWIGGGSGPTQQQQIAYQEWAKKAAEVDMWNKDHGF